MKTKLFLVCCLSAVLLQLNAQPYVQEKLANYNIGDELENVIQANSWTTEVGQWTVSGKNDGANATSKSPVIAAGTLSYTNYVTTNKHISFNPEIMGTQNGYRQSILRFSKNAVSTNVGENVVYFSMMVNLSNNPDGAESSLFGFFKQGAVYDEPVGYALPSSSYNTTWRAKVYAKIEGDQVRIGISKSGYPTVWSTQACNVSETHLLVLKYINNSASSSQANDEFYLLINPDVTQPEPVSTAYMAAEGNQSGGGADLRHVAIISKSFNMKVGQIRVTKTYSEATSPDGSYVSTGKNEVLDTYDFLNMTQEKSELILQSQKDGHIRIVDVLGKIILQNEIKSGELYRVKTSVGSTYIVQFKTRDGKWMNRKVISQGE